MISTQHKGSARSLVVSKNKVLYTLNYTSCIMNVYPVITLYCIKMYNYGVSVLKFSGGILISKNILLKRAEANITKCLEFIHLSDGYFCVQLDYPLYLQLKCFIRKII